MKTNRYIQHITFMLFLTLITSVGSTYGQDRKENVQAMKIAFITQKLDLTPQEAQLFWPLYNQYSEKTMELRKKRRQGKPGREGNRENRPDLDSLSDKEVEQLVNNDMAIRQKELDLQKEYHEKFKAVLPIKKVAKLYAAEEQFKIVLINKLKDRDRPRKNAGMD